MCNPFDGPKQEGTVEPPEWTRERFPQAVEGAESIYNTPYHQFQGMRVSPINDWQHTAGQLTVDRALYGDPQLNTSRGSLMNIAGGGAMNPFMDNAYTDQMIGNNANDMANAFATGTAANTDAAAARSGAYGGSAFNQLKTQQAGELAKQVGNMATSTRQAEIGRQGNLWNQDIGNILSAAGQAPAFSLLDQQSYDSLNRYGGQQQDYQQRLFDEMYGEYNRQQQFPGQQVDDYLRRLNGASGPYGNRTQQETTDPMSGIFSMALNALPFFL